MEHGTGDHPEDEILRFKRETIFKLYICRVRHTAKEKKEKKDCEKLNLKL